MSEKIIQMEQVNKWFGDFQVLKNINKFFDDSMINEIKKIEK